MNRINHSSRFIEECYSRYPKQKLGGHISVIRGVSYKPSDVRSSVDEEVAIILRSNNIADGEINFDDLVYVVQERVQNEQKLKPGDIVMCGSNGSISLVGKAGLLKDNMPNTAFGAFCLGIKCKETILPEYLNTYFNTQVYRNEIESMGNGTNIINIRPDNITNLFIPIPPVEKQMAFVEVVNQADKSKFSDFKSRFISQFGNLLPSHTIGEVAEVYDGTHQTPNYVSEGIRFVSVEDINDLYNSKKFISEADYQKYKHVPTVGDIIMTRIGSIGKCAIVDREEPLAYYVSVSLLKLNHDMIDSRYLRYYLESDFGDKELKLRSLLKAFPMKINLKEIPQVRLILPEIAEQIKFVDVVKQADKSKYLN